MIDSGAFMIGSKVFTFGPAKKVKQKPRISGLFQSVRNSGYSSMVHNLFISSISKFKPS